MGAGFSLGRIFGINIRIDWSWTFIFLLITWNLGVVFGQAHPDWDTPLRWGVALIASLLFFASVLAHELAHSLMAQAQGIPVRNITLFLFGGVSNIQREPPSPRAEFLITIVGPATSILLGILFVGAAIALGAPWQVTGNPANLLTQLDPVTTLFLWLGPINILLGVFNLIPGFPLDGGRILRSILWALTDNLRRATRWAAWVGQLIAWLLIVTGIAMVFGVQVPVFGTGVISGLWLAFIGWFLNSASVQSYRQVLIQDILEDVPVERVMRPNPPTVSPHNSVSSLVHEGVMGTDDHGFPVEDDGRLVGVVTLEDIRRISRHDWDTTTIAQIMTPADQMLTLNVHDCADEALNKLQEKDVRQLPVVDNGQVVGLLRRRDIVRWLQLQGDFEDDSL